MSLPRLSHTEIAAESTRRSTARASISATASTLPCSASAAPSSSSASDTSAASRMLAYRRTFSQAAAALPATTSRTCRSVSSNWSSPSLDRTIAPIGSPSDSIGATIHRLVHGLSAGNVHGVLVDRRVGDAAGAGVNDRSAGDALTDAADEVGGAVVLVLRDRALVCHRDHRVARLGEQVEAAGVVVDEARQLRDNGLAHLAVAVGACHPHRKRVQHLQVRQWPHRGTRRPWRRRRDRSRKRGRGPVGDQLRRLQLRRLKLVRRAHRPDQRAEPLAAGDDRGDDDGVAAVAAADAPLRALRQDRCQPRHAEAVRPDP